MSLYVMRYAKAGPILCRRIYLIKLIQLGENLGNKIQKPLFPLLLNEVFFNKNVLYIYFKFVLCR